MSSAQRRYLPSHAVLRSFECAARHESFTLASEELHLTQSAISRQVKELEQVIGVSLFRRVGRRVVLTQAGRNLAIELAVDLESIRRTVYQAIAAGDRGAALRIAVLPTFASRWLIPRLADFSLLHPNIEISLASRLKPFDLTRERFDLAIHFGTADWPDAKMDKLFDESMIAVSSPTYKEKYLNDDLEQLKQAPLLHLETRADAWHHWFSQFSTTERQVYPGKQFDQFSMIIAGAIASLGAALLPTYMIEKELASGALVRLSQKRLHTRNSYFIVRAAGADNVHADAFAKWLLGAVA